MADGDAKLKAFGIPILLLVLLAGVVVVSDPGSWLAKDAPPAPPGLAVDRTVMEPGEIRLTVTNEGAEQITIAQVLIDEAYWEHKVEPDRTLERLDTATVTIPYRWVQDEPHEIAFVMSDGATVHHGIDAATETPSPGLETFAIYAGLGLFVGVLPIAAGIAWYPAIERAGKKVETAILAFTIGLLGFLIVESLDEALELAEAAPDPLGGPGLVLLGTALAMGTLALVTDRLSGGRTGSTRSRLVAAYMIAVGIGLHNLGEGLAIGASYALGEIALGTSLILGFAMHNVTEGPAIVAPLEAGTRVKHLVAMGAIAGVPTIFGAWMGGFAFSPLMGAIFFALGAGAMLQVIFDVWAEMRAGADLSTLQGPIATGLVLGIAVMWGTGILI